MDWWEKRQKSFEKPVGKVTYKEIPVMVTQSGQLACLPFTNDMPTVGITGIKGSGKSMCLHSFVDQIYHKTDDAIVLLNDAAFETWTYSKPQNDEKFINKLNALGMKPLIVPIVHIFPATTDLTEIPDNITTMKLSLTAKDVFNSKWFFQEGGKSGKYLKDLKDQIEG